MTKRLRIALISFAALLVLLAAALVALLAVPPGQPPAAMPSIGTPFTALDYSDLPPVQTIPVRDGLSLGYRFYRSSSSKVAVLVHGSSGSSTSMHALARSLAREGVATVYALDIRGHGESGPRGDIAYVGQLEDDLADFSTWLRARHAGVPKVLLGFSSGGGFVARIAGSPQESIFDAYLLVSPYLGYNAQTSRPRSEAAWAKPAVPRIIALGILDRVGIRAGQSLTVVQFAVADGDRARLTPAYSYRLWRNFAAHSDYREDIKRASSKPLAVLVGGEDELLYPEYFPRTIHDIAPTVPVEIIAGMGHTGMITSPRAIAAVSAALRTLLSP